MNIGDRVRWGERTGTVVALGFGTNTTFRWWDGKGRKPRGDLESVELVVAGESVKCPTCDQQAPRRVSVRVEYVAPLDLFASESRHAVNVETGGKL